MTRKELEDKINAANSKLQDKAQKAFTEKFGIDLSDACSHLHLAVRHRIERFHRGEAPEPFGDYDRDDIARIFSTNAYLDFNGYEANDEVDVKTISNWRDGAVKLPLVTPSVEAKMRSEFISTFEEYLYTAAVFAKSIGSAAVRPYLLAWDLSTQTSSSFARLRLLPDEALRLANFEKAASKLLWLDAAIANLPKFKVSRPRRKVASSKRKA